MTDLIMLNAILGIYRTESFKFMEGNNEGAEIVCELGGMPIRDWDLNNDVLTLENSAFELKIELNEVDDYEYQLSDNKVSLKADNFPLITWERTK